MVPLYSIINSHKNTEKKESLPKSTKRMNRHSNTPFLFLHEEAPHRTHRMTKAVLKGFESVRLAGVFTLEAAVIMPLLACFFVSILFFFRVLQVEIEVQKALDDTARELAVSLASEELTLGEEAELLAAKALLSSELEKREAAASYIEGGRVGVLLGGSSFTEEEVQLLAVYRVGLPVRIFGINAIRVEQRADCRKWTGDSGNGTGASGEADRWVYITPTGEVYHLSRECSYLKLSIQEVKYRDISRLRNENGEKYRCCTLCVEDNAGLNTVYITDQGNCYHASLNCSGIKRSIFTVRLSEVADRRVCKKCGSN